MGTGFLIKTQVAGSPLTLVPNFPFSPPLPFSRHVEDITEGMSHIGPDSCIP